MIEISDIKKLAKLCKESQGCLSCDKDNKYNIETYGTEVLITKDKKDIYIAFNGTESEVKDIIPHFIRTGVNIGSIGKIHRGYYHKLKIVYYEILNKLWHITNHQCGDYKLYITGHSLGGALAQILTLVLSNKHAISNERGLYGSVPFFKKIECVTFGSCKPIKVLQKGINRPLCQNFYVEEDYVKLFPYGYVVIGDTYVIPNSGAITMVKSYQGRKQDVIKMLLSVFVTERHSIEYYIKQLAKKEAENGKCKK